MSRLLARQPEQNNSLSVHSNRTAQFESSHLVRLKPRPVTQMKLPSLHEMIDLYSNGSGNASLALELPKLRRIPRLGMHSMNQWLEPQEPFRLVVHVPDKLLSNTWPVEAPIPLETENDNKTRSCNVCNKQFSTQTRLRIHSMTHSCKKPFRCEICNEHFAQRCGLTYHTRRVHTGERPYSCSLCSRTFIQKTDLNKHRRVHERHEQTSECGICHETMPQSVMTQHIVTHIP